MENNIKKFRTAKGLTLADIAKEIGVAAPTVYNWEAGRFKPASPNIDKLCVFFECSHNELYPKRSKKEKTINQLAVLRRRAGLSQEQAALAAGAPRETYRGWETGLHNAPLSVIPLLCKALNCTYDEITGVTPVELAEEPETPLKAARRWAGKTQKELGKAAGFSASTYREIEHGKRKASVDEAIKIAEALGVKTFPKFKELFGETQEPKQDGQITLEI